MFFAIGAIRSTMFLHFVRRWRRGDNCADIGEADPNTPVGAGMVPGFCRCRSESESPVHIGILSDGNASVFQCN
jgi:hypothetical protein